MRRTWLTVDVNLLRNELGLPARDNPPPRPGEIQFARPRPPERNRPAPAPNVPGIFKTLACGVYHTQQEAEEGAQLQIAANPALSIIIFEAVGVIESVPTAPVPKKWTDNGDYVPR